MRTTLNRKLIDQGRLAPVVKALPRSQELEWEGYLQLHDFAERLGVLGRDDGLHYLLNDRLRDYEAHFEEAV